MKAKLLEIRDEWMCIQALAFRLESTSEVDRWILARAGYAECDYIGLWPLSGGRQVCTTDPYDHPVAGRTLMEAHRFIAQHFDELESGQVVDVQFILSETSSPCESDRLASENS